MTLLRIVIVDDQCLVAAVESLRQHKPFLTSNVAEVVLDDYIHRTEDDGVSHVVLTPRDREVIQLVAEGKSDKETASAAERQREDH